MTGVNLAALRQYEEALAELSRIYERKISALCDEAAIRLGLTDAVDRLSKIERRQFVEMFAADAFAVLEREHNEGCLRAWKEKKQRSTGGQP